MTGEAGSINGKVIFVQKLSQREHLLGGRTKTVNQQDSPSVRLVGGEEKRETFRM